MESITKNPHVVEFLTNHWEIWPMWFKLGLFFVFGLILGFGIMWGWAKKYYERKAILNTSTVKFEYVVPVVQLRELQEQQQAHVEAMLEMALNNNNSDGPHQD